MKTQIRMLLILVLNYLLFLLSRSAYSQTSYPKEITEKIKQVEQHLGAFIADVDGWSIEERMKYYSIKGLSIAVVHNYKIEWTKGYGWADSVEKRPVTTQTLFEPGSISKSFNAMGVLKLAEDKKLDLYADINSYLTSWKFPYDTVSKNKKISVANLLSHTAGLSVHGFYGYLKGDSLPTIQQVLDGKRPANSEPVRSIFEPGLKFEYSGGGTVISQLIVMDVAHTAYDQYMFNNVFKPLNMNSSFFTQPPPLSKRNLLATGYTSDGKEVKGKYPILVEQAAGGLWTTPSDLCKFIIETQLSYQGKSNKILSKTMTTTMLTPYLDGESALGVFVKENAGVKYFGHDAGNQGFSGAYYGSFENGNGVAVLINSENSGILMEVINSVIETYDWKGFEKKKTKTFVSVPDDILQKYIGVYEATDLDGKTIAKGTIEKKDNCYYWVSNEVKRKMYFSSATEFFNMETPTEKTFYTNAKGAVDGFTSKYGERITNFKKLIN